MKALLLFLSALLVAEAFAPRETFQVVSYAHAQDDDDDDDGGDDDDDGGNDRGNRGERQRSGGRDFLFDFLPRRRTVRRQAPRVERPALPAPTEAPGELVVAEITGADLDRVIADGFSLIARATLASLGGEIARLTAPEGLDLDAARERIRLIAPAARVDANHFYRPVEMPCKQGDCPPFEMIGWAVPPESCGLPATIGMIDTLVNVEHEALRDQSVEILGVLSEGDSASAAVHGTAIAALLVGDGATRTPGLLPNARLVAVEAFHRDGWGDAADVFKITRGLDALSERGVRVVNMSFAGPPNDILERSVALAVSRGSVLLAAAGNSGPAAPPAYPGAYPEVIAVTAVDRSQQVYRQAGRGGHIAFAAPGVRIWTAASISGGRFRSGTSYAVPFVSATVAAHLARHPETTRADIMSVLSAASVDLGETGRDPIFGFGVVKAGLC